MAQEFTIDALVLKFEQFLSDYYKKEIHEAAQLYPEIRSVVVSYDDLRKFSHEIADYLLDHPNNAFYAAETAMRNLMPADAKKPIHFRMRDLPPDPTAKIARINIRDLRSKHLGKFIAIEGLVRKATEVRPKLTEAVFQCARCGCIIRIPQDDMICKEPIECPKDQGGCGKPATQTAFKLLTEPSQILVDDPAKVAEQGVLSSFVDTQKLEVQEIPEGLRGGDQPQRLSAQMEDDLTGRISPGDRIILNGILRSKQRRDHSQKSNVFDIYLDVNSVEAEEHEFEEVPITEDEEREIKKLARTKDIYEKITNSIAPSIWGMTTEKEALMLQLFGGVAKKMPDGTRMRGDIHILFVGDPGTAKSQLLRYIAQLSPRGIFTSGKSSSAAGLTAAAVKDESFGEGRWILEAGALVLADKGIACIDELDKMTNQDRSSMHEAMEQQSYHPLTEITLADGKKVKIGNFVDELMERNKERVVEGVDCEILTLSKEFSIFSAVLDDKDPEMGMVAKLPIDRVSRHNAPDHFVKLQFSNGKEIIVTPEHPVFVGNKGVITSKPADSVIVGEIVPVTIKAEENSAEMLKCNGSSNISFIKVANISTINNNFKGKKKVRYVYDITVEPTHNFISQGLILHNSISIAKAGITATLQSRCAILGAANPKLGRFDDFNPILGQIDLPPALLSRFDAIFSVRDKPESKKDTALAEHILKAHQAGQIMLIREHTQGAGKTEEEEEEALQVVKPEIAPDFLRKYIAYAKRNIFPVLTDEAMETIRNYYVSIRRSGEGKEAGTTVPITARQLEAFVRLSEASAKVRLSHEVTGDDASRAIRIVEYYLRKVAQDGNKIDIDIITTGISSSQRERIKAVIEAVETLAEGSDGAKEEEIAEFVSKKGVDRDKVQGILNKLKSEGRIYEPRAGSGRYKVVK